jgi:hypothetical protein
MLRATSRAAVIVLALIAGLSGGRLAFAAGPPKALVPLEFLLGDWDGGGSGTPGQGSGGTTFARGLQDRVIIRTNVAAIAATDKAPASRHDDLMVIYADEAGGIRADYYDNEGHVIRYVGTVPEAGRVVLTSEAAPGAPRFRLTYDAAPGGAVKGRFAVAAPGKPDAFSPYLDWTMTRVKGK